MKVKSSKEKPIKTNLKHEEPEQSKEKLYIVMNTFAGRYLNENNSKNIGHECINFFTPKGGNNHFLWLNSNGVLPKKWHHFNGHITLVMVTNFANNKNVFRVLAKAENCKIVNKDNKDVLFKNVRYKNKPIQEIFKNNIHHGEVDDFNNVATFYTKKENVYIPENENATITISNDVKIKIDHISQKMSNEKMRMYLQNNTECEKVLEEIDWIKLNSSLGQKRYTMNKRKYKEPKSFFTAVGKEKDELALSNILAYSLTNSSTLLKSFIDGLKKLSSNALFNKAKVAPSNMDYSIERENYHVDLTLEFADFTIIIENKIEASVVEYNKSKLKTEITRLCNDYKIELDNKTISRNINKFLRENNNKKFSQLTKYYIQSKLNAIKEGRNPKNIAYFFLVPNYCVNKFTNEKGQIKDYLFGENYDIITYKDIHDIFNRKISYAYKKEILTELKLLSKKVDNSNMNRQLYKFLDSLTK